MAIMSFILTTKDTKDTKEKHFFATTRLLRLVAVITGTLSVVGSRFANTAAAQEAKAGDRSVYRVEIPDQTAEAFVFLRVLRD
jgi:hypothetical protein